MHCLVTGIVVPDPGNLEKAMAPHSSTLAWKVPWTEEPGRLQSMRSLRVRHNRATSLSLSCLGEGNGNPLQCSCLENPRDGATWWAAVYGVVQSRTRLKWLSSSSSSHSSGAFLHWVVGCLYILWRLRFVRSVVSNCSPPGSSVHGIFQAKVLEWGAIAFSIVSMCFSLFLLMGINLFPEKLCRS